MLNESTGREDEVVERLSVWTKKEKERLKRKKKEILMQEKVYKLLAGKPFSVYLSCEKIRRLAYGINFKTRKELKKN